MPPSSNASKERFAARRNVLRRSISRSSQIKQSSQGCNGRLSRKGPRLQIDLTVGLRVPADSSGVTRLVVQKAVRQNGPGSCYRDASASIATDPVLYDKTVVTVDKAEGLCPAFGITERQARQRLLAANSVTRTLFYANLCLLHLERDFATGDVTVGGENLPAKHIGLLSRARGRLPIARRGRAAPGCRFFPRCHQV